MTTTTRPPGAGKPPGRGRRGRNADRDADTTATGRSKQPADEASGEARTSGRTRRQAGAPAGPSAGNPRPRPAAPSRVAKATKPARTAVKPAKPAKKAASAKSAVEDEAPRPAARRTAAAPRTPFVLLIIGLLGGALVSLLLLNTVLAEDAFTLTRLQKNNKMLGQQKQALQEDIAREESPAILAQRAEALGMVKPTQVAYLDEPTGRVIGGPVRPVPHAAAATAGAAGVVGIPGAVVPGDGVPTATGTPGGTSQPQAGQPSAGQRSGTQQQPADRRPGQPSAGQRSGTQQQPADRRPGQSTGAP